MLSPWQAQYARAGEAPGGAHLKALRMGEDPPKDVPPPPQPGGSRWEEIGPLFELMGSGTAQTADYERVLQDIKSQRASVGGVDPAQEAALERASASLQRALKLAGTPGGLESLSEEEKARAIAAAEEGITLPGQTTIQR